MDNKWWVTNLLHFKTPWNNYTNFDECEQYENFFQMCQKLCWKINYGNLVVPNVKTLFKAYENNRNIKGSSNFLSHCVYIIVR